MRRRRVVIVVGGQKWTLLLQTPATRNLPLLETFFSLCCCTNIYCMYTYCTCTKASMDPTKMVKFDRVTGPVSPTHSRNTHLHTQRIQHMRKFIIIVHLYLWDTRQSWQREKQLIIIRSS